MDGRQKTTAMHCSELAQIRRSRVRIPTAAIHYSAVSNGSANMKVFILKQFHRYMSGIAVGKLVSEWAIDAPDLSTAIFVGEERLLTDFKPPDDFAVLFDEDGKVAWNSEI
jgi:hypothetical protein